MSGQENAGMYLERASKKRASAPIQLLPFSSSKKRAVLGDLTNFPDAGSGSEDHDRRPKLMAQNNFKDGNSIDTESPQNSECDSKLLSKGNGGDSEVENVPSWSNQQTSFGLGSMYKYLRFLETEEIRRPRPRYMEEVQIDLLPHMREILVDWLVEVAEEYQLYSDTLYCAVSYIDRYLSIKAIRRNRLQLLGICCLLIASKFEEISPPHVEDFCYVTDNTYRKEEVTDMEDDILKSLKSEMGIPTVKNFLRIFTRAVEQTCNYYSMQFEFLCCYLAELSLLDYECLRFVPSVIAASAVFLSKFTSQPKLNPWGRELQQCSGYKASDLKECVLALHCSELNYRKKSLKGIRNKYMQHKFKSVAELSPPSEIPSYYFDDIAD